MAQTTSLPSYNILQTWVVANPQSWLPSWDCAVRSTYAAEVLSQLGPDRIDFPTGEQRLDSEPGRIQLTSTEATYALWAEFLIAAKAAELNSALVTAAPRLRSQSSGQLRAILTSMASTAVVGLAANATVASSLDFVWPLVAHALANEVHHLAISKVPEWRIHSRLLLTAYFTGCRMRRLQDVLTDLRQAHDLRLGVRGAFTRIVQHLTRPHCGQQNTIADPAPPLALGTNLGAAVVQAEPSWTGIVFAETKAVQLGCGLLHQLVSLNRPIPQAATAAGHSPDMMLLARDEAFRLYEHCIVAHLATASVEQTLRSIAEHFGVQHVRCDLSGEVAPVGVMSWIGELGLPPKANAAAARLFGAVGGNVRNRVMHASLIDVDMKRYEALLRRTSPALVSTTTDPFSIQNIAALCMEALADIDSVCGAFALSASDYGWTSLLDLSPQESAFATHLRIGMDGPDGVNWQQNLRDFLCVFSPQLGQFVSTSLLTWGRRNGQVLDVAPAVLAFEAVFRVTCMVLGLPVLNVAVSCNRMKVQYFMLDREGLMSQQHFRRILVDLPSAMCSDAAETLRIAVKCRNAFAHGALAVASPARVDSILAVLWGATDVMIHAARQHMVREAAYFNWQKRASQMSVGTPEDDWTAATQQVCEEIRVEAKKRRLP